MRGVKYVYFCNCISLTCDQNVSVKGFDAYCMHVRSLTREIRVRVMRICRLCVHKKARDSIAVCFFILFYFLFNSSTDKTATQDRR